MKKSAVILAVLALVGCGKEQAPQAQVNKPMVTVGPATVTTGDGQPVPVTQTVTTTQMPVQELPVLNEEQTKQEARAVYKDAKAAQAQAVKTLDFLKNYPPFSSLSYQNLLTIAKSCQVLYFKFQIKKRPSDVSVYFIFQIVMTLSQVFRVTNVEF